MLSRHLLNEGNTAGSIGTLGTVDGAEQPLPNAPTLTTPGVFDLYDTLSRLAREGVRTTIVEVSSHALDQRRIEGLQLRAGVYTNLSHDHLDYHGDMGAYREAKMRLSGAVRNGGMEIVNADDSAWDALPEDPRLRRVRYGTVGGCHVHARGIELGAESTTMVLTFGSAQLRATTPLIGAFNVSNVLAGCALAWALKRDPETIVARLAEAPQVPGAPRENSSRRMGDFARLLAHTGRARSGDQDSPCYNSGATRRAVRVWWGPRSGQASRDGAHRRRRGRSRHRHVGQSSH